jgi:energy-coupling factor transporter ATP-binding protein EcfA2
MLNGVELAQFVDSFDHLGLTPFLHKQFGKLSGGQQLRVNLAAAIMRRNPSLILLDEPLAALDEKNAIAALQVLRNISVNHAFVMTVHQPSNTISGQFDRMLSFDAKHRKSIFETSNRALIQGNESDVPTDPDLTNFIPRRTFQAALILWHGQFYGFPAMEILTFLISVISAVLTALIARPGLIGYPVLTPQSVRIPLYASFMLFGITFITSFGVSIIYAMREKQIYENYTSSKSMKTWVYLLTSTFRSVFFGILQSFLWTVVGLPLMGLFTNTSDIIFVNTSLYGSIWTFASFGTSLALPVAFGAHAVMLLDVYAIFFSGIFSLYSMAYAIIRVLQYINPLFYVVASNAALLVQQFDPGCGATDHPGICAQPEAILEMNQIRSWTSLETQGILLAFYVLLFLIFWFKLAPRGRTAKGGMRDDDNSQTPVIRFARHLSIVVSERSVRTEDDIHPPLDEWEEVRQAANMLAKGRSMGRRLTLEDMLHSVNLVGISEEEKQLVGMEGEEEMVGMAEGEEEKIGIVKAREDTDRCKHDTSNLSLFG